MQSTVIRKRIIYPESDGTPMGETDTHVREITSLFSMLDNRYRDDPDVNVGANMMCYYVEGDPSKCFSPDVFIVFGIPKLSRRTFKVWEELKPPTVIFEVSSRKTQREDKGSKKSLYLSLRVQEYFIYDPLREYLHPPLQGFRLKGAHYAPIHAEEDGALISQRLDLRMKLEHRSLVLSDLATGERLLRYEETDQRRLEAERGKLEAEQAKIAAEQRASVEEHRRLEAEAEIARLRRELARRRKKGGK